MKTKLALLFALAMSSTAHAGVTDILNPPPMLAGGWEVNSSGNIGQSFNAAASDVTLGVYVADQETYNKALQAICVSSSCNVTPWDTTLVVSPSISLDVTVYEGEGLNGKVIYQSTAPITLKKPFNGIASLNLGAAGVFLTVGKQYTVIYNETSSSTHTYWQLFSTIDRTPMVNPTTGQIDPNYNHGSYYGGWAYIQGVQQNPDSNIGDIAFQVIDNTPVVANASIACQGTSTIVSSTNVSKLFMTLANGAKVAYSNVYGSKGTTLFTYNGGIAVGTFPIGSNVTYVGVLDASTICVPNALTIDPAPVVPPPAPTCSGSQVLQNNQCVTPPSSCAVPTNVLKVQGKGKITAVSSNSITIGKTIVFFNNCTVLQTKTTTTAFAIGQVAEYKGYKAANGITATTIIR